MEQSDKSFEVLDKSIPHSQSWASSISMTFRLPRSSSPLNEKLIKGEDIMTDRYVGQLINNTYGQSLFIIEHLPILCFIDDVTYFHVERPVFAL